MDAKDVHASVAELGLRTYQSKFTGKCSICQKDYNPGNTIARLTPDILKTLNALGMSTKVYKYCHVECIPLLLPESYIAPIKEAAEYLLGLTDPEWPKDEMGFSAGDASPAAKWVQADCPRIGAHNIARRLRKYVDTQLGGPDTDRNKAIIKAGNAKAYRDVYIDGHPSEKTATEEKAAASAPTVACETIPGAVIRERKITGEIFIEANGATELKVQLDPPWVNEEHAAVKDAIKHVGARWDKADKCWRMGPGIIAMSWSTCFVGQKVAITEEAAKRIDAALDRRALSQAASVQDAGTGEEIQTRLRKVLPEGLELYPFQTAGVAFVEAANGRALIGDEMGLGKTMQALAYCALHPEQRPVLCVVPAVVATNWVRESQKWLPGDTTIRVKNGKDAIPANATIIIITYDLARRRVEDLKKLKPQTLVVDEVHYMKNIKAKRTAAILDFVKEVNPAAVIALSGTPIVNRPVEFFTALRMLRPNDFRSWWKYTERYCDGHRTRWGYECSGATNTEELASKIRDLMVRRKKEAVLTELPAKIRTTTEVEMNPKEWRAYKAAVAAAYANNDAGDHLAAISAGRKSVGDAKVRHAVEWIREYKDQGQPVIVVAHHGAVIDAIKTACDADNIRCGVINQQVLAEGLGRAVDAFQNNQTDVIIIAAKSGGVGITLTAASNVLFVERQWTPGDEEQAEDRAHRIGQTNAVQVRYLTVMGSVDEDMNDLIEAKRQVLHDVLDGVAISKEKLDIRSELVRRWKRRLEDGDQTRLRKRTCKAKK